MRRFVSRNRLAVMLVAVVCAVAWVRPSLEARTEPVGGFGGQGAGADATDTPIPRVYFEAPFSAERARVLAKLQQKKIADGRSAPETPLDDVDQVRSRRRPRPPTWSTESRSTSTRWA